MNDTEVGLIEGRIVGVYEGWAKTGAHYKRVTLETVDGPEVLWDYTGAISWGRDTVVVAVRRSKDAQYLNVDSVIASRDQDKEESVP